MLHALLNDFGLHVNQYTPGMETGRFILSFGLGEITFKRDSALTLERVGTAVLQSPPCQVGKQCVVENTTQLIATLTELYSDARHAEKFSRAEKLFHECECLNPRPRSPRIFNTRSGGGQLT